MNIDFECHLTVEGQVSANTLATVQAWGWKASEIDGDPEMGAGRRLFLTRHFQVFADAHSAACAVADVFGYRVTRKKIELIVADTRAGTW
jgi:hypothetical protein